jgi:hypothetical protein
MRPFPHGRKDKQIKNKRNNRLKAEVEASRTPDLPDNLSVDTVCYNMFPHYGKWVLWL